MKWPYMISIVYWSILYCISRKLKINGHYVVLVLSPCQSSQLNIKNLKELLSKMAANYSETANNLKSKAENTSLKHVNQSRGHQQRQRYRRHQLNQERMCRMIARDILNMLRYITEPKCAADGNYESIQCGSSGRRCWCVDVNGKMVGFMKSRDKLNCSAKGRKRKLLMTRNLPTINTRIHPILTISESFNFTDQPLFFYKRRIVAGPMIQQFNP